MDLYNPPKYHTTLVDPSRPELNYKLLERLPVEVVHQILDSVPRTHRVRVLRSLEPNTHLAACVRTHYVHGQGLDVLEEDDFALLSELLAFIQGFAAESPEAEELDASRLPPVNGRIWLALNRTGILYNAEKCLTRGSIKEFFALNTARVKRNDPSQIIGWRRRLCNGLHRSGAVLDLQRVIVITRAVYARIEHIKAQQLERLADSMDKYGGFLRNSADPERVLRANRSHQAQLLRENAKCLEGYGILGVAGKQGFSRLFRGPCLPAIPLDSCLDVVLRTLYGGLRARSSDEHAPESVDPLCAELKMNWDVLVASSGGEASAAKHLFWKGTEATKAKLDALPLDFAELGSDIHKCLAGIESTFDYKRPNLLPRIELSSNPKGKSKEDDQPTSKKTSKKTRYQHNYNSARQRFSKPPAPLPTPSNPCIRGAHTARRRPQSLPATNLPHFQFVDHMSPDAPHPVPGDNLLAPFDEREIEWLEAFLRLAKVFREDWTWRKDHEGQCAFLTSGPVMTREEGVRRAAWVEGLETGRAIESPRVAAERVMRTAEREWDLPGEMPFYVRMM